MRLLQCRILRIMTVDTQRWGRLREVKAVFQSRLCAALVRDVAGVATRVECSMTAAFFRNIRALGMAGETEIVFLVACGRLQQLVLVLRRMRIVAFEAIADRRRMNGALNFGGIFVGVAGETESVGCGSNQLYTGDILVDPDLVAAQTAHRDGRMYGLAFGLVLVALETLCGIDLGIERNRVNGGGGAREEQRDHRK